jgi:hypothetical protein
MNLVKAFGWQGGTIHQVAQETGCFQHLLIYGEPRDMALFEMGVKAAALDHEFRLSILGNFRGVLDFWLGLASAI